MKQGPPRTLGVASEFVGSTIAYFDCFSGISGDMALGALIDSGADRAVLDAAVEALGLTGEVTIEVRHETRGHAGGTRVLVGVTERIERTVPALRLVVEESGAPEGVKVPALDAINRLARAEARVHGIAEEQVHLHELGGADTLVDVVGVFWLLHALDVVRVYSSPLPAPRGLKGGMPLPAPASLRVLEGSGAVFQPTDEQRELVTPTGAAILAASATFERPAMMMRRVGYGIGAHDAPGNSLAVWIGDEVAGQTGVTLLETNLDDMAPNLIAALAEDLMAAGARLSLGDLHAENDLSSQLATARVAERETQHIGRLVVVEIALVQHDPRDSPVADPACDRGATRDRGHDADRAGAGQGQGAGWATSRGRARVRGLPPHLAPDRHGSTRGDARGCRGGST